MWLNQSFLIEHGLDNQLDETFVSMKDGKVLKIHMKSDGTVSVIAFLTCLFIHIYLCTDYTQNRGY